MKIEPYLYFKREDPRTHMVWLSEDTVTQVVLGHPGVPCVCGRRSDAPPLRLSYVLPVVPEKEDKEDP